MDLVEEPSRISLHSRLLMNALPREALRLVRQSHSAGGRKPVWRHCRRHVPAWNFNRQEPDLEPAFVSCQSGAAHPGDWGRPLPL